MRFIIIFICSLLLNSVFAEVINYQTDTFANIAAQFKELGADPKTTLMVFDLDDTLITMTQPLGSIGWWDWQHELQKQGENSDKLYPWTIIPVDRRNEYIESLEQASVHQNILPFAKFIASCIH